MKRYSIVGNHYMEDSDGPFVLFNEITTPAESSVLQDWVMRLPLRHQGVICAALRGYDQDPKHGIAKPVNRAIRRVCMNPADERECVEPLAYMHFDPRTFYDHAVDLSRNMDSYSLHYMLHIIHACEVIGYHHPDNETRNLFYKAYQRFCFKMHLEPETKGQLTRRLTYDRVAAGTTVWD